MSLFRTIESELKKLEKTYNYIIQYLVSEANYHASTLNEYPSIPDSDKVFEAHVIAYLTNCKAIQEFEKSSQTLANTNPIVCIHDLNSITQSLKDI